MILVANKVDLMHLRKITREQGKEMATKHNVGCVCVCWGCQEMGKSQYPIAPVVLAVGMELGPPR